MEPLADVIFMTVFLCCIFTVAVVGNLLIIIAVSTNRRLQTVSNFLFLNLAVSDFFQGSVSIPLRLAEQLNGSLVKPLVPCNVVIPLAVFFYGASNLNLTLISIDRFVALYRPMKYKNMVTPFKATFCVVLCWLVAFVLSVLPALGW
ncbi:predicted protein, partial [Nematostella vectensis]